MKIAIDAVRIPTHRHRALGDITGLAESLSAIGLINPITVSPDGTLIAGLHRLEAARALGWTQIEAVTLDTSALLQELAEIDENLIRAELSAADRARHSARRKAIYLAMHPETAKGLAGANERWKGGGDANEIVSFASDTAAKTGKSVRTIEQDVQIGENIDDGVWESLDGTPVEDRKTDLLKLSRMPKQQQKRVASKVRAGAKSVKEALKEIDREEKTPSPADIAEAGAASFITVARCREFDVEPGSVDVIITDPPYPAGFLDCYSELGELAARALKPGGSVIAMCGQSYLPDIITRLSAHLTYHWTLAYLTPGGQSVQLWDRKVNTFWKPLLWFRRAPVPVSDAKWQGDVVGSATNDNDKRFHDWGQSESGMAAIVDRFSYPGDLVMDPFAGAGTTGVVCVKLGRRFFGCDLDPTHVATANARIGAVRA